MLFWQRKNIQYVCILLYITVCKPVSSNIGKHKRSWRYPSNSHHDSSPIYHQQQELYLHRYETTWHIITSQHGGGGDSAALRVHQYLHAKYKCAISILQGWIRVKWKWETTWKSTSTSTIMKMQNMMSHSWWEVWSICTRVNVWLCGFPQLM